MQYGTSSQSQIKGIRALVENPASNESREWSRQSKAARESILRAANLPMFLAVLEWADLSPVQRLAIRDAVTAIAKARGLINAK